jgi:pimeloyl-ACP methyl ester carboxylesterase
MDTYQEQDWQEMQIDLLHLSSNSQHLIADTSGHSVQFDQPAAAVEAIVKMVDQVRRQAVQ